MHEAIPPLKKHTAEQSNVITQETTDDNSRFERLPTPEDVEMLQLANNIVLDEITKLGIDPTQVRRIIPFPVPLERVRVLLPGHPRLEDGIAHVSFAEGYVGIGSPGTLDDFMGDLDTDVKKLRRFRSLLHEVVHAAGISEFTHNGTRMRAGYSILNLTPDTAGHEHLRGFNEGVVESLSLYWFFKHRAEIGRALNVANEIFDDEHLKGSGYETEMHVVEELTRRIAAAKQEPVGTVGERIARGHFNGALMQLRDIDSAFGRGSLRVLAAIRSTPLYENTEDKITQRSSEIASALLHEGTDAERDEKVRDTLTSEEYFAYMRDKYSKSLDEAIILASTLKGRLTKDDPSTAVIASAFHHAQKMLNAIAPREDIGWDGKPIKKTPRYAQSYLDESKKMAARKWSILRGECERLGLFEQNLA